MGIKQVLQKSIRDLQAITHVDLCLMDLQGKVEISTFPAEHISAELVQSFVHSAADSQVVGEHYFFKVTDEWSVEYVLVSRDAGEDAYLVGRIAASQIQNLLAACRERLDKDHFIQNLLLDNLLLVDIYNKAKKLRIAIEAKRCVFLIETKNEKDSLALETMKMLFAAQTDDLITAVDEKSIILVHELREEEGYEALEESGRTIRDMLNAEAMSAVRIAYGTIVGEIKDVSKSYKEARMALDVGKIFYSERSIISYSALGIGRLIYQLPLPLCEMFLRETFGEHRPDTFEEDTLATINRFFDNSLNVSETSRQLYLHRNTLVYRLEKIQKISGLDVRSFEDAMTFKIGLMVFNYMNYLKEKES